MTTDRCSAPLCSTFSRSASGVIFGLRLRKTAVSGHPRNGRLADPQDLDEVAQRSLGPLAVLRHDPATALPGREHGVDADRNDDRQPTAGEDLDEVRSEERKVDDPEEHSGEGDSPAPPSPPRV